MRRALSAIAFGTAVTVSAAYASGVAPAPEFDDAICPQANDAGRQLNALSTNGSTDDQPLVYAAQGLIDAYHDCARSYDLAYRHPESIDPGDRAFVHRLYARLELALAYQRVGILAEQLQQPDGARAQYDGVLQTVDDIEKVARGKTLPSASEAGRLVAQARDLQTAVAQVESELRPARIPSPQPSPRR